MAHFRQTRTVHNFPDRSELLFLSDENRYIWQRPEDDPRYVVEVPIVADSDAVAVMEVKRIIQQI